MDFQDAPTKPSSPKAERNPNNFNILKGGKVDPGSKLYQRSVAGREQLKDYLSRLWNDGADEADVFMAGVKSLMNRGHGYVGAYLDSKNPGRRYEKNQAMAITDQVMTDEGIGEHPGNRLTRPKVEDEEGNIDKEATKEARAKRKEANQGRGFGPKQAPGQRAMPVGQQRKQGKRTGSERVAEDDTRRAGIDDPTKYEQPVRTGTGETEFYNREQVKKTLEDRLNGKATTEDVLAAFQKTYQKPLSDSPQADAERRRKRAESRDRFYTTGSGKMPEEEKKPAGGGAQPTTGGAKPSGAQPPTGEAAPAQPPTSESKPPAAAPEGKESLVPDRDIQVLFKDLVQGTKDINKKSIESIITEISQTLREDQGVEISDADVQNSIRKVDGYSRFLDKYGIESSAPSEQPAAAPAPAAAPQPKAAPDRQAQTTDEAVMRRATLMSGKTAAPQVKYSPPNVEREWNEAARYPEFESAGIEAWKDAVKSGTTSKLSQLGDVKNLDLDYDSLDEGKKNNFQNAFKGGLIETPIVGRWGDGSYEVIAGNTRLAGLVKNGVDPQVKVVDFPSGDEEEAAPAAAPKKPGRGLNVPAQPARKGGGGFTPKAGKRAMDTIRQAANSGKTPQEVVEQFKQGKLFGKAGFETGSAATNPLEGGSTPTPTESPEEFAPSSKLPGAGGPTPETAKAGQPGQQSLFRSGTTTPRTGSGFGKPQPPAPPSGPVETPQDRAKRMTELTDSGMSSDAALKQMEKEGTVKTRTEGGKGRVRRAPEQGQKPAKRTPIMDDVVRGAGNVSRGIGNAFNKARERHNKSIGGKFFQVSEQDGGTQMSYEEFAQSVRSLLR